MSRRSSAGVRDAGAVPRWGRWPGLLCLAVVLSGCQTWTSGMTLPSGKYLEHPPQYFPPTPDEFRQPPQSPTFTLPLPRELAAKERASEAALATASAAEGHLRDRQLPDLILCGTYDVNSIGSRLDGPAESQKQVVRANDPLATGLKQILDDVAQAHPLLGGAAPVADEEACEEIATPPVCEEPIDWETRIRRALESKVKLDLENVPLKKVVDDLRAAHEINVVLDVPALQEAGISLESPVTIQLEDVALKQALDLVLHQVKLTFQVKDEAILITTEPPANGRPALVVHAAADLIASDAVAAGQKDRGEALVRLITSSVAPQSWRENGGRGIIEYHPLTQALVINQTPNVQEQVQDLLASLRRQHVRQISLELRFVTVGGGCFRKLGLDAGAFPVPAVETIDEGRAVRLLEAAQEDPSSNVVQAPKLTCFNNQKTNLEVTGERAWVLTEQSNGATAATEPVATGFRATLRPRFDAVSGRRFLVGMDLRLGRLDSDEAQVTRPESASGGLFRARKTLVIDEGKTALLYGWTQEREVSDESRLGSVPYVGRLFKHAKKTRKEHVLVLVTPRLVEEKVEEKAQTTVAAEDALPAPRGEPLPPVLPSPPPPPPSIFAERVKPATATPLRVPTRQEEWAVSIPSASPAVDAAPQHRMESPSPTPEVVWSNSRTLALAYDVDNVGPSKLAGVEVYFTNDGERWQRYPGLVRPSGAVPMTVAREGRYGFTLIARSGSGLAKPAPKAGEAPQLWVEVDTTAPQAELLPVSASEQTPGTVSLSWRSSDRNPHPQPVTLEWAAEREGPWSLIATDLEGSGSYSWSPPEEAGGKVYLRLSARDLAGNLATVVTPEPIAVDGKVPSVTGVRLRSRR